MKLYERATLRKSALCALVVLFICAPLQLCLANEPIKSMENSQKEVFTPESVLPTGVDSTFSTNPYTGESGPARKGTVAATLNNIALLNALLSEKISSNDQIKAEAIIEAMTSLIPSLSFVGVFDLFTPEEWLSSKTQPGRVLAAVLYLQKYPQNITSEIKQRLLQIQAQTKIQILSAAIAKALQASQS